MKDYHITKLAGWRSGERQSKRKGQSMRLVPVLWHEIVSEPAKPL